MASSILPAVIITNAYKRYSSKAVVLKGLNMTVANGTIYGLLGPSGCGKTTLLSCIVGRKTLDSGDIRLIVKQKEKLGYMPQDLSLNNEFTIKEILQFYGRISNMEEDLIEERSKFLINLLELPPGDRNVVNCSGGQQRRISLAVTLVHNPELLILDEPTVGLDPLLNEKIWNYFLKLSKEDKKTIIITTHYIEEAKHSHAIGLMRGGKLLAEEPPQSLLIRFNTDSLEEVFLKLSEIQDDTEKVGEIEEEYPKTKNKLPTINDTTNFRMKRFKAQVNKNLKWAKNNIDVTLFVILLVPFQFAISCVTFNKLPTGVSVGFMSEEMTEFCRPDSVMVHEEECVKPVPLSCRVMNQIGTEYDIVQYGTVEEAIKATVEGHIYGYLSFPKNFSKFLVERLVHQSDASDEALTYGTIDAQLDQSSFAISLWLKRNIHFSLQTVLQEICRECDFPEKLGTIPLEAQTPVHGQNQKYFMTFIGPSLNSLSFYSTFMYTSAAIIMERTSGNLERMQIAGLTIVEILAAHMVLQTVLMTVQNLSGFLILYVLFDNFVMGSYFTAYFLVTLAQCLGVAYGFLLAIIVPAEQLIAYAGIGSVVTLFFGSGVIWAVEGESLVVRIMSELIPITPLSRSYTFVSNRGWSLWNLAVLDGVLKTVFGIGVLLVTSYVLLRLKIATF